MRKRLFFFEISMVLLLSAIFLVSFSIGKGWSLTGLDRYVVAFSCSAFTVIIGFLISVFISSMSRLSAWVVFLTITLASAIAALVIGVVMIFKIGFLTTIGIVLLMVLAIFFSLLAIGSLLYAFSIAKENYKLKLNFPFPLLGFLTMVALILLTTFLY